MSSVANITPYFQIVNNGSAPVALNSLKIRYYFTKDGCSPTDLSFVCDFFYGLGCSNLSSTLNTTTGMNADEYAEISFSSPTVLAPGSLAGPIQVRIHATDFACQFDQTNDYSFDSTKTIFALWSHVTLYLNGTLVWGTEP
jgi:hypothetical protein